MNSILVERSGRTTLVTINRPERRNAVDAETALRLREVFADFDADDDASVAVLTGGGGTFCSGYDLHTLPLGVPPLDAQGPGPMGPTRMLLSKPVIAAVEGHAVAGGLELALWCDMRVASANAIFGVFCRRWGVPLIDGGTVRLPRVVGHGRALDMILTGRPVGADEALAIGLASRVVPAGSALEQAMSLARAISAFPQTCLRADRLSAYQQWDSALTAALQAEALAGEVPLREEGLFGAARFSDGAGRSGHFNG
ncbi:MAG TPA: crotonase/enoyl-CoA hydratase family protein [Allosphingosinicella sp.]|jgi:enoyl-CoA hydratase